MRLNLFIGHYVMNLRNIPDLREGVLHQVSEKWERNGEESLWANSFIQGV